MYRIVPPGSPPREWTYHKLPPGSRELFDFRWRSEGGDLYINVPHWAHLLPVALLAGLPWLRTWRFSLRTLLIVTTLVAVGLGLNVWLR